MYAIESKGLIKDYRDVRALDGLDLRIVEGQVYGFCGPNGAGKTTTLKIFVGLVFPTGGSARVLRMDVTKDGVEVRRKRSDTFPRPTAFRNVRPSGVSSGTWGSCREYRGTR